MKPLVTTVAPNGVIKRFRHKAAAAKFDDSSTTPVRMSCSDLGALRESDHFLLLKALDKMLSHAWLVKLYS